MKDCYKIFLIILLVSCNNEQGKKEIKNSTDSTAKNTVRQRSMKGFDLYAWEKDGTAFFTLLPGTNRIKTSEEIYDIKNAVEGINAIENKINEIDTGEYIFLTPIQIDTNDLKPLIEYMKGKNLKVTIIPKKI